MTYPDYDAIKHNKLPIMSNTLNLVRHSKEKLSAQFECLTPEKSNGKHIQIVISGFLSEYDDHDKDWEGLVGLSTDTPVYCFKWKSKSVIDFAKSLWKSTDGWVLFTVKGILKKIAAVLQVVETIKSSREVFTHAISIAEISGKILAHALMNQFPFRNQSISLLGFSLGSQVIYSCLKELKQHGADNIIHNVYFLGGAVSVEDGNDWANTLSIVNGTVYNGYCKKDYILQIYRATIFKYPIGLGPIFDTEEKDPEDKLEKKNSSKRLNSEVHKSINIKNIDVTNEATGHLQYRKKMTEVLEAIDFCF